MRISEISCWYNEATKKNRADRQLAFRSGPFSDALRNACQKDDSVKHFGKVNWKRTFLSKTRYMGGRQCSKRLWQTVYDPEPAEEPLPGTLMGMGTEVGIKARLLWPGGVLVHTKYHQAAAIKRTQGPI